MSPAIAKTIRTSIMVKPALRPEENRRGPEEKLVAEVYTRLSLFVAGGLKPPPERINLVRGTVS
jgi:hypothetical protein